MVLNILHISSGNLYGGVETLLATLARERTCCPGMKPHFALCFEGRLSSELRGLGAPATMLGSVQTRFPWTIWRARRALTNLLVREHIDVVVCHMPWSLALFGPVARRRNKPLVFWMHDAATGRHWVERWAGRVHADLVLCNSRYTAGTLPLLFHGRSPAYEIVYCPVSDQSAPLLAEERARLRRSCATPVGDCVIIQVSRMESYKGHRLHLDALSRIADLPNWTCWMVGGAQRPHEARYLAELRSRAAAAGILDRVHFLGDRRDVPQLLQAADIFCQPNERPEPFGMVFIEALYAGLPVASTEMGGVQEIVDGSTGTLVPPGSAEALAGVLRGWIQEASHRKAPGGAGPARARARALCGPPGALARLEELCSGVRACAVELKHGPPNFGETL